MQSKNKQKKKHPENNRLHLINTNSQTSNTKVKLKDKQNIKQSKPRQH